MNEQEHGGADEPSSSLLAEEVRTWNTPLVGAYQLWQFTLGYCECRPDGDAPIGLLHFIAESILTSPKLCESVSRRRENLQSYAAGFESKKEIDLLLGLQERIRQRRPKTLAAIDAAICAGLLFWDTESGKLYPQQEPTVLKGRSLRVSMKREGEKAKILGGWFAAHDIPTITAYLKVVF